MNNTYCIIMAGGSGSRFWPVTQTDAPKQFLDIMGTGKSMLQTTFERFEQICPRENIIVVTSSQFVQQVHDQIPDLQHHQVLGEPYRRNTAPCVLYAASVINHLNPEANIIVTPSDHAIFGEEGFVSDMRQALAIAQDSNSIITVGVRPTMPNTKYGYIQFNEQPDHTDLPRLHKVVTFTEKPPLDMARQFIATGEFFWNAGIFVWNIHTLLNTFRKHLPSLSDAFSHVGQSTTTEDIHRIYSLCESISVDVGIMEKTDNVHVLESSFGWSDVETWDLLYNTCDHDQDGNCFLHGQVFAYEVKNTLVHIPSDTKLIVQGLDGYIIAGNPNMLMICPRDQEERIVKFASDVELADILGTKGGNLTK